MRRREFLARATLAGAAVGLGVEARSAAAEPPPETTTLVLHGNPTGLCIAPQYVAEDLLKAEGFAEIRYLPKSRVGANQALASGEINFTSAFIGNYLVQLDAGDPLVVLAGLHIGCFELFASERVRTIRDLKGKTVSVSELGAGRHVFLASAMAYVGLDPRKDVNFVAHSGPESMRLLAEGKIDGYQAFGEEVPEVRARKIGHVVLSSTLDRPWSQYFCCVVAANREFVRKNPVATKRALRAILKASTICALEPDRVVGLLVEKGYTREREYVRQMLKELPYTRWRDLGLEDTIRFYAVRMHEAGFIKSTPQKLLVQGTDRRFLDEIRKELKG